MKSQSTLEHPGIVSKIKGGIIYVDIEVVSACASCHAKGYCTAFGKSDKVIEIPSSQYPDIVPGDMVNVIIRESLGMQALVLGYILPVVVLLIALFTTFALTRHEGMAALVTLGAIAAYYLGLYLLKDKIRKHFTFSLIKL